MRYFQIIKKKIIPHRRVSFIHLDVHDLHLLPLVVLVPNMKPMITLEATVELGAVIVRTDDFRPARFFDAPPEKQAPLSRPSRSCQRHSTLGTGDAHSRRQHPSSSGLGWATAGASRALRSSGDSGRTRVRTGSEHSAAGGTGAFFPKTLWPRLLSSFSFSPGSRPHSFPQRQRRCQPHLQLTADPACAFQIATPISLTTRERLRCEIRDVRAVSGGGTRWSRG